jgi:ABC-type uncharacterized transport system permease subunit
MIAATTWETIAALSGGIICAILWGLITGTLRLRSRSHRRSHRQRR